MWRACIQSQRRMPLVLIKVRDGIWPNTSFVVSLVLTVVWDDWQLSIFLVMSLQGLVCSVGSTRNNRRSSGIQGTALD